MARLILLTLLSLFAFSTSAAEPPVYTGLLSNAGAGGYDTVAYFEEGKPVEGSSRFTTEHLGATWRFSSEENLNQFLANPERYVPAYGGYCAWAVSQGYLAKGDPEHWSIRDGRLFLNYNRAVQTSWLENPDELIVKGDANWPNVLD
ncbi:MAG: YHS domain-containing (seleno)protein [Pseudomonadota bacterium]|nr:YHS domain-containing (seleno)protein [Pseudomonadota bacterium]